MNPKCNYGIWMIMIFQCRFISFCTTLVGYVGSQGAVHMWGQGVYGKCPYRLLNFALNLKLCLKNTVFIKELTVREKAVFNKHSICLIVYVFQST